LLFFALLRCFSLPLPIVSLPDLRSIETTLGGRGSDRPDQTPRSGVRWTSSGRRLRRYELLHSIRSRFEPTEVSRSPAADVAVHDNRCIIL
jgi:hypothetical protein